MLVAAAQNGYNHSFVFCPLPPTVAGETASLLASHESDGTQVPSFSGFSANHGSATGGEPAAGVFRIPFPATPQVHDLAAAHGLPISGESPAADRSRRARFHFIAGPENRLLETALQGLFAPQQSKTVQRPDLPATTAHPPFSLTGPLFFHGPADCGKTHLVHGIAAAWRSAAERKRGVICIGAAEWSAKLLPLKRFIAPADETDSAPQSDEAPDASHTSRQSADDIRLLVLDDLHRLRQTPACFAHFRCVFDALEARGVPMVFTSRLPPEELNGWPASLRARMGGGLVVPVAMPSETARGAILRELARLCRIDLSPDAAELLAKQLNIGVPDLLAALAELHRSRPRGGSITVDSAARFLALRGRRVPSLERIAQAVARRQGLKPAELLSASRRRHLVAARGMLIHLARRMTDHSLAEIGRFCGGRDHTTTLHSLRKMDRLLAGDPDLARTIEQLSVELQQN